MSTRIHAFPSSGFEDRGRTESPIFRPRGSFDPGLFAEEQIRRLVRRVFFPGWPQPACHVGFAAADSGTEIASICLKVAQVLSTQSPGTSCLVKCDPAESDVADLGLAVSRRNCIGDKPCSLQNSAGRLSSKLWFLPHSVFMDAGENEVSASQLELRVQKLRMEFDYSVLWLPPAESNGEAAMIASLCDGVVLVVQANSTRRAAAQRAKQMLQAANVRVLGTVLSERTFPIPERLYRKL